MLEPLRGSPIVVTCPHCGHTGPAAVSKVGPPPSAPQSRFLFLNSMTADNACLVQRRQPRCSYSAYQMAWCTDLCMSVDKARKQTFETCVLTVLYGTVLQITAQTGCVIEYLSLLWSLSSRVQKLWRGKQGEMNIYSRVGPEKHWLRVQESGFVTYFSSFMLCFLGCCILSLFPFCSDCTKDWVYRCRRCGALFGRERP